jgi:hypothetical protein
MEIVHGFVCKTCCDVDLAKKGINPADPQDDVHNPKSPNYGKAEDPQHPGKPRADNPAAPPAVTFGGMLARVDGLGHAPDVGATPFKPYTTGAVASLSA